MKTFMHNVLQNLNKYCDDTNSKIDKLNKDIAIKDALVDTLLSDKEKLNTRVAQLEAVQPCTHGNEMAIINRLNLEVARLQSIVYTRLPLAPPPSGSTPTQQPKAPGPPPTSPPQANNATIGAGSVPAQTGSASPQSGRVAERAGIIPGHQTDPPATSVPATSMPAQRNTGRENGNQQQLHSPQQTQNNTNGIKRGPKKVDQIFISQVHLSYTCENLTDHIHDRTRIDKDLIQVEFQFIKHGNKAFKITVPNGKMKDTIKSLGTNIKAEPFKEKHQRSTKTGQASRAGWNNSQRRFNNYNNSNTFHGPSTYGRPPYANGRQPYWDYELSEWNDYGYPPYY